MTSRPAALLLLAVLVGGCSSAPDEPAADPTPATSTPTESPSDRPTRARPAPPPPTEGECYPLSFEQAVAPTVRIAPAPCRQTHTVETFHVGRLERVIDGRLLAVDSRRVQEQVATTCPRLLPDLIGGTEEQRRLSMLRSVWFTPTLRESDAGADWFRCDAVGLARDGELLTLTGSLAGVLDTEVGRTRYGMCGTAEPGTTQFQRVACSRAHTWRALRSVILPGPDYPGAERARQAGEDPCTAAARAVAPDPLEFRWSYEFPTAEQWQAGQNYGLCWAPQS